MSSDNGDVPPTPPNQADLEIPLRHCERCNATMKQLGELPSLSIHAAIRIYRCYSCDHVVSEQM